MSAPPEAPGGAGKLVGDFLGLPPLQEAKLGQLAAAVAIVAFSVVVGWIARGAIQKRLNKIAHKLCPKEDEDSLDIGRIATGLGELSAAVALSAVSALWDWSPYAEFVIDLALALVAGLAVYYLVLGVFRSESAALAVAIVVAVVTMTSSYDQLDTVRDSLDSISTTLGSTSISLLGAVNLAISTVILYAVVKVLARVLRAVIRSRTRLDESQRELTEKLAMIGLGVVAILAVIELAGIDVMALSIFSGTLGIGLGFGLQKVLSNFVSGIVLLWDRSVKPGDTIVIDANDVAGEVIKVGTRAVSVITRDGKVHLIPNEILMTERVENWGYQLPRVRLRMAISVAIGSDYDLVQRLMVEAATEQGRVLVDPTPRVRITGVSDNGVVHELRFWIGDPGRGLGNVRSATYRSILDKFAEHDVTISIPVVELASSDARHPDALDPAD